MLKISCVFNNETIQFPSPSEMLTSTQSSNHVSLCQVIWNRAKLQLELLSLSFLQVLLKTIAEFQDRHLISPFMFLQSALEGLVLLALY